MSGWLDLVFADGFLNVLNVLEIEAVVFRYSFARPLSEPPERNLSAFVLRCWLALSTNRSAELLQPTLVGCCRSPRPFNRWHARRIASQNAIRR